MHYRTRVYIAADWDGDKDAVNKLREWNNSGYWSLSFPDAHELIQARDSSLNCSIKQSLKNRMDASKTFVLIVGGNTRNVKSGSCQYCNSYNAWTSSCARYHTIDYRSYIAYECDKAKEAGIKIVVLYNSTIVDKSKCPEVIRFIGTHLPMKYYSSYTGQVSWNYGPIKNAIMG